MKPATRLACLALSVAAMAVTTAACQRTAPDADPAATAATTAPSAAPSPAPVEPTPPFVPATDAASDAGALDVRAFAGTLLGTLPCASCPGIRTELTLGPDGTFTLAETYLEQADGARELKGTWSAEDDGARLRLDPDSKSDEDRVFQIVSRDEVRLLDRSGAPIDSTLDYSLRRMPASN